MNLPTIERPRALRAAIEGRVTACSNNAAGHRAAGTHEGRLIADFGDAQANAHRVDVLELDTIFPEARS
jgi:hypothetical protein